MKLLLVTIITLGLLAPISFATSPNYTKLRPYTGIGVLLLSVAPGVDGEKPESLYLYQEPAISRLAELNGNMVPPYEWIFGMNSMKMPLIVTSRNGNWLRVMYDDAGREGWLMVHRQGIFQPWATFFKGRFARLLPGLQKQYCQLYQEPGNVPLPGASTKKSFKIIKLEGDWALVMPDLNSMGWLRWRDEDGRLLIGLEQVLSTRK